MLTRTNFCSLICFVDIFEMSITYIKGILGDPGTRLSGARKIKRRFRSARKFTLVVRKAPTETAVLSSSRPIILPLGLRGCIKGCNAINDWKQEHYVTVQSVLFILVFPVLICCDFLYPPAMC